MRVPLLWNKVLSRTQKEPQETSLFKGKLKTKPLKLDHKVKQFSII